MIISWFSCGATSAIACKIALNKYKDVKVIYIETGSHHPDNARLIKECEPWLGVKIDIVQNAKYSSVIDLIRRRRFINSPNGALCTYELKKRLRYELEDELKPENQIFGFDYSPRELKRAKRFTEQYPDARALFPLIELEITKPQALAMLSKAGIALPIMYKQGYKNNNCIGCVKGGKGYWNRIRNDYPDIFKEMINIEEEIGHTVINGRKLKSLRPEEGNYKAEKNISCDLFCELEFLKL